MWKPVSSLASLVEPPQAYKQGRSCFCREIVCESVYKNTSVKITRSKEQVYIWCHSTWGILTSCEEVATAVSLHPVLHVEQSWDELPHIHSCHPTSTLADFASSADFATVASVSLQRKPYQCIHTWVHMQHQLWIL